jgi:hypothetical protein
LKILLVALALSLSLSLPLSSQQSSSQESSLPITLSREDYEAMLAAMELAASALTTSNDEIARLEKLSTKLYFVCGTLLVVDLVLTIMIIAQELKGK